MLVLAGVIVACSNVCNINSRTSHFIFIIKVVIVHIIAAAAAVDVADVVIMISKGK